MPRGYLKHQERDCGGKRARGGSSKRTKKPRALNRRPKTRGERLALKATRHVDTTPRWRDKVSEVARDREPEYVGATTNKKDAHNGSPARDCKQHKIGKCAICLDEKQTLRVMKKCQHPLACEDCLRETFVVQAQKNIWNYPLKCFYPSCNKLIGKTQIELFTRTEEELKRHYRFSVLGQSYRGSQQVVHCPSCDHPKHFHRPRNECKFACRACKTSYYVNVDGKTNERSTIRAIESIKRDKVGRNDGWCRCPKCKMIISKGDGCDHIACPCGQHFYFSEWKQTSRTSNPQPQLPQAEIVRVTESMKNLWCQREGKPWCSQLWASEADVCGKRQTPVIRWVDWPPVSGSCDVIIRVV